LVLAVNQVKKGEWPLPEARERVMSGKQLSAKRRLGMTRNTEELNHERLLVTVILDSLSERREHVFVISIEQMDRSSKDVVIVVVVDSFVVDVVVNKRMTFAHRRDLS
jgi:hypothetical protein